MTEFQPIQVPSGPPSASDPAGVAAGTVRALLDNDAELGGELDDDDVRKLINAAGVGRVVAQISNAEELPNNRGWFITRWDVIYNGVKVGTISRNSGQPLTFWGRPAIGAGSTSPSAKYDSIRSAITWMLYSRLRHFDRASQLARLAYVEESSSGTRVAPARKIEIRKRDNGKEELLIPDLGMITHEQWERISGIMRGKGYDSRGATDASRAVQSMTRNSVEADGVRVLWHEDWINGIAKVLGLRGSAPIPAAKNVASAAKRVFAKAVRAYGLTDDPSMAGYILPNGSLLNLSGGSGVRAYDHREVCRFLDPADEGRTGTQCMHEFMDLGAIRWMPEGNGIYIRVPPTQRQYAQLASIKDDTKGTFYMDVYSPNYGHDAREYGSNIPGHRVVNDIRSFYKTGKLGGMSQVQKFHGMGESIVSLLLGEAEEQMHLNLGDQGYSDDGDIDDTDISPEDIAVNSGVIEKYVQIDGDFGDPWAYGGTWFSAYVARSGVRWDSIVHIDGLEGEGIYDEYDSGSKPVLKRLESPENQEKIKARAAEILLKKLDDQGVGKYPDADPAEEAETRKWCEREALDEATDEIASAIAEEMEANRKMQVYRTNDDDPFEDDQRAISDAMGQFSLSHDEWVKLSNADKVCLYGSIRGWYEIDSQPILMTKAELMSKYKLDL